MTGFGPFEQYSENPSSLIAESVDGMNFRDVQIVGRQIDVSWNRAWGQLADLVETTQPDALLCLGVAPDVNFRMEAMTRNQASSKADAFGEFYAHPSASMVDEHGPDEMPSTLPLEWLQQEMQARCDRRQAATNKQAYVAGVVPSNDAGDYLCNYVFYHARQELSETVPCREFIHVPSEFAVEGADAPLTEILAAGNHLIERLASWLVTQ